MFAAGYVQMVAWEAVFLVLALAVPAMWAWYLHGRTLAATTEAEQRRVLGLGLVVSAGVGAAILVLGVVAFVLTGYNWLVFAVVWSVGLLHLGLLTWGYLRAHRRTRSPASS
jgi:hypothetical protein